MTFLRFFPARSAAGSRRRRPSNAHARRASFALVLILVAALAVGCGGNATPGAQGSPTGAPTSPGSTANPTNPGATSPSPSSTKPGPTVTATPSGKATSTQPGSSAALDLACVRRGVDTQGITVATQPGGPASYNTIYSDGSGAGDGKSTYQTGFGGGFADATGTWRATWIVPADAPPGTATVFVPTKDGRLELKFDVVDQSATCPA